MSEIAFRLNALEHSSITNNLIHHIMNEFTEGRNKKVFHTTGTIQSRGHKPFIKMSNCPQASHGQSRVFSDYKHSFQKPHTITLLKKENILCLSFPLSCYVILHSVQTSFNKHICQVQCTKIQTSRQNARLLQTCINYQLSAINLSWIFLTDE